MTVVVNIFQYIFPVLVVSIAVVLLCFYLHAKKKRAAYDVTIPTQDGNTSSVLHIISLPEDQAEEDRQYDRVPPRYSTVDLPPPYSLFDPKLTSVWPGAAPPAYEMYPITLPLAPHHWTTPTGPLHTTRPSSSSTHNDPRPQRLHQASSG